MATAKSITTLPKISLVIPCYNESHRVQQLLDGLNEFDKNWNGHYELIIVDDGSNDGTLEAIQAASFIQSHADNAKIISLNKNSGKGHALKEGVAAATGDFILTLDADMSTRPVELKTWVNANKGQFAPDEIWIGSREHANSKITEVKSRKTMGRIFNLIVRLLTPLSQHDTQCGFKLYPAAIAKKIFSGLKTSGWAHDVELLYRARLDGILIREMPVKWDTMSGSKISPFTDAIKMFWQVLTVSLLMKWNYFITTPLKSFSSKNQTAGSEKNIIFRFLFFITSVFLLILMMSLSHQYGITGDEKVQKEYGEKVLSYYTSFGQDTTCLHYRNLYIYGGLFDGLCAAVNKVQHFMDPYNMRHLLNSIFGFMAILFCGLLAKYLTKSWRAGWIALILLAISPTFFGHCMNNPKDIPFAAAYIFSIYYLFKYIGEMPNPSLRTRILLIIGFAITINVRVGGLILIGMLGAFLVAEFILSKKFRSYFKTEKRFLNRLVKQFIIISVISYFAGLIFWPYGLSGPISNPFSALSQFSNFSTGIRILYDGQHIMSQDIPWDYIPTWISITAPIVVLLAAFFYVVSIPWQWKNISLPVLLLLIFVCVFPWAYTTFKKSALYDGWRHMLFIYPLLVVMAALFWEFVFQSVKSKAMQMVAALALAGGIALPLTWSIRNHPNEAVYFNEWFGGVNAAYGQYETDYYMNSVKQTCDWFHQQNDLVKNDKIIIATNAADPVSYYFRKDTAHIKIIYTRFDDRWKKNWDYGIFYSRFIDKSQLRQNLWLGSHCIHKTKADTVPLSVVVERKDKSNLLGQAALDQNDFISAAGYFSDAVKYEPLSDANWVGLGFARLNLFSQGQQNKMNPDSLHKLMQQSIDAFHSAQQINPSNDQTWFYLGYLNALVGQTESAITDLEQCIQLNQANINAYQLLGTIYQQKGDMQTAQQYFNAVKQIQQMMQGR